MFQFDSENEDGICWANTILAEMRHVNKEVMAMAKAKVLFNISGHPLPENPKGYVTVDIQVPTADLSTPEKVIDLVKTLLALPYKDHLDPLMKGEYEVVLPGMSIVAAVSIAILHGIGGHFPTLRWTYPDPTEKGKFKLSKPFDLQKLRIDSREARFFGTLP